MCFSHLGQPPGADSLRRKASPLLLTSQCQFFSPILLHIRDLRSTPAFPRSSITLTMLSLLALLTLASTLIPAYAQLTITQPTTDHWCFLPSQLWCGAIRRLMRCRGRTKPQYTRLDRRRNSSDTILALHHQPQYCDPC